MINKLLFVIMHGQNCQSRYDNVVKTWGSNVDFVFYSDYEDSEKKIIKTTNDTGYSGLEIKMINVIDVIIEKFGNYEWFLFCDDDTYVNVDKLNEELNNFDKKFVHGQILIHGWPHDTDLIFCSGGAGILIHKENLIKLFKKSKINGVLGAADVGFFMNIKDNNIEVKNSGLFKNNTPQSFGISDSDLKNYITFHNIKTFEDMSKIHNVILNNL